VARSSLPKSERRVFCRKLNGLLAQAEFDGTVEKLSEPCTVALNHVPDVVSVRHIARELRLFARLLIRRVRD
jgi:hypothetical protein